MCLSKHLLIGLISVVGVFVMALDRRRKEVRAVAYRGGCLAAGGPRNVGTQEKGSVSHAGTRNTRGAKFRY